MKNFRKNEQGFFVCEECEKTFVYKKTLSYHINKEHNSKQYYDKWLKNENEGICKICNKETKFLNFKKGYKNCCSIQCNNANNHKLLKLSLLEKYGVENQFQRKDVKEKILNTCQKLYNVDNPAKNLEVKNKTKQTCLKKYGVEYSLQSQYVKNKSIKTCIKKFGTENPMQNKEIFNKSFKTRLQLHKYKDTQLTYQGTYELNFLNKFHNKIDIENGPSIKYKVGDKNKVYHSDFYIPSLNLIVEIKSNWTLKQDVDIEEKKKVTIANGFNYLMILDKNYEKLTIS